MSLNTNGIHFCLCSYPHLEDRNTQGPGAPPHRCARLSFVDLYRTCASLGSEPFLRMFLAAFPPRGRALPQGSCYPPAAPRHVALHAILTALFLLTSFPNFESSFQSDSVSLSKWFQSWKTTANKISDAQIRKNYFKERKGSKLAAPVGVSLEGPGPHAL